MAYIDQFTLSQDATFKSKIRIALIRGANTVIANNTAQHIDVARRILRDSATYTDIVALGVQSDATVSASAPTGNSLTDAQIQTAVAAFIGNLIQ